MSPPMINAPLTELSQALAAKNISRVELVDAICSRASTGATAS